MRRSSAVRYSTSPSARIASVMVLGGSAGKGYWTSWGVGASESIACAASVAREPALDAEPPNPVDASIAVVEPPEAPAPAAAVGLPPVAAAGLSPSLPPHELVPTQSVHTPIDTNRQGPTRSKQRSDH